MSLCRLEHLAGAAEAALEANTAIAAADKTLINSLSLHLRLKPAQLTFQQGRYYYKLHDEI